MGTQWVVRREESAGTERGADMWDSLVYVRKWEAEHEKLRVCTRAASFSAQTRSQAAAHCFGFHLLLTSDDSNHHP